MTAAPFDCSLSLRGRVRVGLPLRQATIFHPRRFTLPPSLSPKGARLKNCDAVQGNRVLISAGWVGGAEIAGLQGLIFRFSAHFRSFPAIPAIPGWPLVQGRPAGISGGLCMPSVIDIALMLERWHQAWQGANDTSFSSSSDRPAMGRSLLDYAAGRLYDCRWREPP